MSQVLSTFLVLSCFSFLRIGMAEKYTNFKVRNVQSPQEELNERQRGLFALKLTFSKEGQPVDLPSFQLQIFPTAGNLTLDSELSVEQAIEDYLRTYFKTLYPNLDDDDDDETPQFNSIEVDVTGMRPVTSEDTRHGRRLQRQGTEFNVQTIMRFNDGIFPEYGALEESMQDAMFNNFNEFLTSFLPLYSTEELSGVDSGNYISGFTDPPTLSPSMVPTDSRGIISEINSNIPVNVQNTWGINPIYPAVICGGAVFILTALWLSYRRKRIADADMDALSGIDHISVDFDGRQEALDLERQRHRQQRKLRKTQEYSEEDKERQIEEESPRKENRKRPWHISGEQVQSYSMEDGRTTVHITPEGATYADESKTELPMIINVASSMSGVSYRDDGHDLMSTPTGSSEYMNSSAVRYPSEGQRRPLPSMRRGGAEFGLSRGDLY